MSAERSRLPDPEEIEATAAVWLSLRDRGMSEEETAEFMRWLQETPRHGQVFAELDRVWRDVDRLGVMRPEGPLAPHPDLLAPRPRVRSVGIRRAAAWGAIAAAAAVMVAWFAWQRIVPVAETAVGAFQKLDLPDGSVVQLNTDSAIKVRFSETERRVELLRGEAHFDVAKNPARPFLVSADKVTVRAVGTAFNVRLRPESVEVLVTEGRVQVNDSVRGDTLLAAPPERVGTPVLERGERVRVPLAAVESSAPTGVPINEVAAVEVQRALAWQERRLEFDDAPLREVVAEFNRYNQTKLVLTDPGLARRRFSGTFRADGYEPFVRLLEESFEVVSDRSGQEIFLRSGR